MDLENNRLPISPHDNDNKKKPKFICMFLLIFFIWAISFFIFCQTRSPRFYVNSFDVSISNISIANPLNTSSLSSITATWNIDFIVENAYTFKTTLSYEPVVISVYYGGENLSSTIIAPFDQVSSTKHAQHVVAIVHASTKTIFNGKVAYAVAMDWTRGTVWFDVAVDTRVNLHPKFFFKQRHKVKGMCKNLKVGVSSNNNNGVLLGDSVVCS